MQGTFKCLYMIVYIFILKTFNNFLTVYIYLFCFENKHMYFSALFMNHLSKLQVFHVISHSFVNGPATLKYSLLFPPLMMYNKHVLVWILVYSLVSSRHQNVHLFLFYWDLKTSSDHGNMDVNLMVLDRLLEKAFIIIVWY